MHRSYWYLPIKVAVPVLIGQFLFDCVSGGVAQAADKLPVRAAVLLAVVIVWSAWRRRRKLQKSSTR